MALIFCDQCGRPVKPSSAGSDGPPRHRDCQTVARERSEGRTADYEHAAPRLGGYAFASLMFFGLGQLLKGHLRMFLILWGIVIASVAGIIGTLAVFGGDSPFRYAAVPFFVLLGGVWLYQLWDAMTRPK